MLMPLKMDLLSVVVPRGREEELLGLLGATGMFQPLDARTLYGSIERLSPLDVVRERTEIEQLRERVRRVLSLLGEEVVPLPALQPLLLADVEAVIAGAETVVVSLDTERLNLEQYQGSLNEQLSGEGTLPAWAETNVFHEYLVVMTGKIAEKNREAFEQELSVVPHFLAPLPPVRGEPWVLLLALKADTSRVGEICRKAGWVPVEPEERQFELPLDKRNELAGTLKNVRVRLDEIAREIKGARERFRPGLLRAELALALRMVFLDAKAQGLGTAMTVLVIGWVPSRERPRIEKLIAARLASSFVEAGPAAATAVASEDIPVSLRHHPLIRPFEMLIGAYGIPRYGTVDPTLFVGVSFLLMFGAMFGDLGHGLLLVLGSVALIRRVVVRQAGILLLYCGISSMIFGLLYGSIFGHVFHSLWFDPIADIPSAMRVAISFGMVLLTLGVLLNIVNALLERSVVHALFGKAGILAGIFYWAGIAAATDFLVHQTVTSRVPLFIMGGVGLALFIEPIVGSLLEGSDPVSAVVESSLHMVEIVTGYLANTVSFVRVAAFSLAHAGLFMAVFALSNVVRSVAGGVFSVLVIIFGNLFIVALEGLGVSIQSLRLNYYEFFSRFFVAGKRLYEPFVLTLPSANRKGGG